MGIPSYFAMLVRRHKAVLKAYRGESAQNLCLDSNSIVYDMVRTLSPGKEGFEQQLIAAVCRRIDEYISQVRPRRVFIAFDGVPPMAKMKQQRERRYKGRAGLSPGWDTVQITPGTTFMRALSAGLTAHFNAEYAARFTYFRLSTSEEPGEGEHKLFEWLRSVAPDGNTYVYGLDSDLIILALQNLPRTPRMHLLREAPNGGLQLLDVALLGKQIEQVLGRGKLGDYIFLTFFLGNDFMPHFPALNLRTRGLDTLLQTYREQVSAAEHLFKDGAVEWATVHKLVRALARRETAEVAREYADRGAQAVEDKPENAPRLHREAEHYICPPTPNWEDRYYSLLLKCEPASAGRVCDDFYRMLEWNARYYCVGCPDWELYYPHAYPPLLRDLAKSTFAGGAPAAATSAPKTETELLQFVLPAEVAHYAAVPYTPQKQHPETLWAFCTFDWESHLLF